jgi:hypothetical protein
VILSVELAKPAEDLCVAFVEPTVEVYALDKLAASA